MKNTFTIWLVNKASILHKKLIQVPEPFVFDAKCTDMGK